MPRPTCVCGWYVTGSQVKPRAVELKFRFLFYIIWSYFAHSFIFLGLRMRRYLNKIQIYSAAASVLAGSALVTYDLGSKPASCIDSSGRFHSPWHSCVWISFPGFSTGKPTSHPCHFPVPTCVVPGPLSTGTALPLFPWPWKASLTPKQTPVPTRGWAIYSAVTGECSKSCWQLCQHKGQRACTAQNECKVHSS